MTLEEWQKQEDDKRKDTPEKRAGDLRLAGYCLLILIASGLIIYSGPYNLNELSFPLHQFLQLVVFAIFVTVPVCSIVLIVFGIQGRYSDLFGGWGRILTIISWILAAPLFLFVCLRFFG